VALVGGPLGEVLKNEQKPTAENGHDHTTTCGFFPKGYDLRKAGRPPERGLMLQLHAMRNNADAKGFYENTVGMVKEMAKESGSPTAGAKVTTVKGMGEAATIELDKIEPEPKAVYQVVKLYFLKGRVMGHVTAWKKAAPADEIARAAAKQIIAKLP